MSLLEEIVETLRDAPLETVCVGAHWTAVVVRRGALRCGLASTLVGEGPHGESPVRWAGRLLEHGALELAGLLRSEQRLEASIGLAAVNALLEVDESRLREENALHLLEREGRGKRVALIGHFPFIPRLRQAVGELWVLEQHLLPGEFPAERAAELLPQADVVAITGAALVNHTLEGLLALCRPGAFVLVLGPSTPLSTVLFRYGATALAGTRVVDPAAALRCVSQGATFRQIEGVRTVVMTR
ncbi:MAG: Rossmann-like domain-containing protein [Chloroflexia bacterium]